MQLIEVVRDDSMMVPGYEDQTFKCSGCNEVERRRAFRVEAASTAPAETDAESAQAATSTQEPVAVSTAAASNGISAVQRHPAPPPSSASAGAGELDAEEMLRRAIALVRAPGHRSQPLRGLTDRQRGPAMPATSIGTKRVAVSRLIQIRHDPSFEAAYAAKDTKSGLVVLRHPDSARLRSMCERLGWQVLGEESPAVEE
jgi:hypothetical protein